VLGSCRHCCCPTLLPPVLLLVLLMRTLLLNWAWHLQGMRDAGQAHIRRDS
jgi:hypothetical protein